MRLLLGLTQEELAGLARISRPSLVNYEQGGYSPIDDILIRLAEIFGVEPGYLRYGAPTVKNQVWIPSIPKHSQRKQNLVDELKKLLPEFIEENNFSGVVVGALADGGYTFVLGQGNDYDCLLVINPDLYDVVNNSFSKISNIQIERNKHGKVAKFDASCLAFIHREMLKLNLRFDSSEMKQSLIRQFLIKTRYITTSAAVSLEYAAISDSQAKDLLLRVADCICREIVDISLEQLLAAKDQKEHQSILDISSQPNQVSKICSVILKAAYDVLVEEQKIKP